MSTFHSYIKCIYVHIHRNIKCISKCKFNIYTSSNCNSMCNVYISSSSMSIQYFIQELKNQSVIVLIQELKGTSSIIFFVNYQINLQCMKQFY